MLGFDRCQQEEQRHGPSDRAEDNEQHLAKIVRIHQAPVPRPLARHVSVGWAN
jgi:hypothetical protein